MWYSNGITTKLDLDPKVLEAATKLAEGSGRSLGQVMSELAKKGLKQEEAWTPSSVRFDVRNGLPVALVDPPPSPVAPDVVRRELEENG